MTFHNLRTTYAEPTQKRKFATVPLNREPLTQRQLSGALDRRDSIAAASVGMLRLGYAPDVTLGCFTGVMPDRRGIGDGGEEGGLNGEGQA